ncbi:hypothetical protein [Blastococcus sp. Marseille-P5729]|uniref:hypothetical protein n=1 Tax=Blastococcus sp. Marseille-P5729 TaxID=2086582 RepID=UPI000D0E4120|nr:hypothetical protein [Blastococcus sp. Marseille-P5729]
MIPSEVLLPIVVLVGWLALEVPTIFLAARANGSGGSARLRKIGYRFLGTEAWTLVLLGVFHGVLPGAAHAVYAAAPWAPTLFVTGWMVRDIGLWLGPRSGGGAGWRRLVSLGARGQLLGASATLVVLAVLRPAPEPGSGADLLVVVVPPVLVVGLALMWWLNRLHARRAQGVRQTRPCDRPSVPEWPG